MIIFGTKVRYKVVGEGEFLCPKCEQTRAYQRKKAVRYFSLYFVPVIPIGQLGEVVECQTCGMTFKPEVLTQRITLQPRARAVNLPDLINTLPHKLAGGMPAEYAVRDLTTGGVDRDVAQEMVTTYLGPRSKTCPDCGLTFMATVPRCTECERDL